MPRNENRRALLEASSLGLMFPIAIAIGFFWGRWMDGVFGTGRWLTWIFTVFGVIAAFMNLFRLAGSADPPQDPPADDRGDE